MKKKSFEILTKLFAILIFFISSAGWAATYFVDATDGSDYNNGLSQSKAWRSIKKVNGVNFQPGDFINFKRGGLWIEQLNVPSSGSFDSPIVFGAYGNGEKPIISGSGKDACIKVIAKQNIIIRDIHVKQSNRHGIYLLKDESSGGSNIKVENVSADYNVIGITIHGTSGFKIHDILINNCEIDQNSAYGILVDEYAEDIVISNNVVYNNGWDRSSISEWPLAGIRIISAPSGRDNINNITIEHNRVYDNGDKGPISELHIGFGIHCDSIAKSIVRYNKVYSNSREGIFIENSEYIDVYYNLIYDHNRSVNASGLSLYRENNNCRLYNNIIYNNFVGIMSGSGNKKVKGFVNNLIINNISYDNSHRNLMAYDGGQNDGIYGSGNVYEFNCFGKESNGFIEWGFDKSFNTYRAWELAYGKVTQSVESDPGLTDSLNNDFSLKPDSPCIDAGKDVGLLKDFIGNSVPHGNGVEVGAFEFNSSSINPPNTSALNPPKNLKIFIK